jgi:hypothetical protein
MTTDLNLNPDGPHSPDRTREVGQLFDDASRFLCYATMERRGGLTYPADVYALVADLYAATGRFPQICEQLEAFLRAQEATGCLYEARQRDIGIGIQCNRAAVHLDMAAAHAAALTKALQAVQSDIAGLGVKENPGAC